MRWIIKGLQERGREFGFYAKNTEKLVNILQPERIMI